MERELINEFKHAAKHLLEFNKERLEAHSYEEDYSRIFYDKYTSAQDILNNYENLYEIIDIDNFGDYSSWIRKYTELVKEYSKFLKLCELNPYSFKRTIPIELYKGSFDSLKAYFDRLMIYSLYATTINYEHNTKNINLDEVVVRDNVPCHKVLQKNKNVIYLPFNTELFDTYFVHNPYNKTEEKRIMKLFENDDINVIYGLYGFSYESDIDDKIIDLMNLKSQIEGSKFYELRKESKDLGSYHMGIIYKPKNIKKYRN